MPRPVVLVTGVGRTVSIGTAVVRRLASDGWDVAYSAFAPEERFADRLDAELRDLGAATRFIEADLADPAAPGRLVADAESALGPLTAVVASHAESVDSGILDTTVDGFDRHFAVNTRATWLLIKAFAERFGMPPGTGRIVALTSDHTAHNMPYGASKGALDRIVIAAATELGHLGITANVVNPGPVDTGWIAPDLARTLAGMTALGRLGTQEDAANLIAFLLSAEGGWIDGQLLHSNGGFHLPV